MDEIDALRTLGREVPAPEPVAKRAARAALLAHAEAAAVRPRWLPDGRLGLKGRQVAGALAALGLVVILASGLLPLGRGPDPAAAAALNRAADVAATQPAGSGVGYRHTKSEGAYLSGVGGWPDHPNGIWALVPVTREIWVKSDGSGRIGESRGEPIWFGRRTKPPGWRQAPRICEGRHSRTRSSARRLLGSSQARPRHGPAASPTRTSTPSPPMPEPFAA